VLIDFDRSGSFWIRIPYVSHTYPPSSRVCKLNISRISQDTILEHDSVSHYNVLWFKRSRPDRFKSRQEAVDHAYFDPPAGRNRGDR